MSVQKRKDSKGRILYTGEYERKDGYYEYKWTGKNGKRNSRYASTLNQLRKIEAKIKNDVKYDVACESKLVVNDIFDRWKEIKRGLKDNTLKNYIYMYDNFVRHSLGKIRITELRKSDVRVFYNKLVEERKICVSTVDSIHTVLHQVLEFAVDDGYIRVNPSDKSLMELKRTAEKSDKKEALTRSEEEIFENFLRNNSTYHKWYPIFTVMLKTGMRVGEVTGLRWSDVNLEKGYISVNHTLVYYSKGENQGMTYSINSPKTTKGKRIIPVGEVVKEALLMEKEYQKKENIKSKSIIDGYSDFIFVNRFGEVYNNSVLNKALKRITKECNLDIISGKKDDKFLLPSISNHILRHTFTTRMIEAGVDVKVVQSILGHSDIRTTLDIYTDVHEEFRNSEFGKVLKIADAVQSG